MANTQRPDQAAKLQRLEKKRLRLGVSLDELAALSGVPARKIYRIRRDRRGFDSDIRKLTFALRAIEREEPMEMASFGVRASGLEAAARMAFQGFLAAVSGRLPEKYERKAALYLLVTGANVPSATAGRVYGCTKQYVSKAVRQVEDLREDPELGGAFRDLEATLFSGRPA